MENLRIQVIMTTKKLTTEEFIRKSRIIHGDKYDYSLVNYKNTRTKVIIICREHGEFNRKASSHLEGFSCNKCSKKYKLTTEEFINKSQKIHQNKYDYSLVNYKNSFIKVQINCPYHGEFKQQPRNHLKGFGCMACSGKKQKTTDDFIAEANKIHQNKYDYSNSFYTISKNNLDIICKKHGLFTQRADKHLEGRGCPSCNESKGENLIKKFLNEKLITYEIQKNFDNCINPKTGKKLSFDFYLPNLNICIEYDGEQHFKSVNFFGGENSLLETQYRDRIKDKFCEDNDINLKRINYKQFNNIEIEIDKMLSLYQSVCLPKSN